MAYEACTCVKSLSNVQLFVTLQTVAHQGPLSMGFSRPEYWSGLPFPPPGDLPDPGIKPSSPVSPALGGRYFTTAPHGKPMVYGRFGQIKDFSLNLSDREKGCNDY